MADNISNEYNMVKILQDVGANFFPGDLSEQRVGMFGFTCEAMARLFGATILDSNMRANEYHTITAKKLDTLLYDAAVLGLTDIDNVNPSTITAYIAFDTSSIHRTEFCNPDVTTENPNYPTYYFIIERDSTINIAGYNFMLEWDIQVTAKYNGKEYIYSARYLSEGDEDPHDNDICHDRVYIREDTLSTLSDKYIQGNIVKSGNTDLFMMKVNLRQMEKKYEYYIVTETDMISLTGLEFQYDDYLSHFNVYYRESQSSDWEYILPISVYDSSEYSDKTIQYEIDKDSKIIILNATGFDMNYNSELRIDIFTTKGSNGNIMYSGNGDDIICTLNSYDGNHVYNGIDIACIPITSAKYGKDGSTIDVVRGKVIRAKSSKKALSTEYDLYNFMKEHDLVNDYIFIKKRSDILEHIYGTFTIPRTVNEDIIPTTTLNLIIDKNAENNSKNGIMLENRLLTIKAGTPFRNITDDDADIVSSANTDFNIDENLNKFVATLYNRVDSEGNIESNDKIVSKENDTKMYGLPYTIVYDTLNQLSSIYLTSISRTVNMSSTIINDDLEESSNFIIDHINISRNSFVGDDSYDIEVSVMPNGDYSNCVSAGDVNINNVKDGLMLKGFIYNKDQSDLTNNNGTEYPFAFFNFDFVSFVNGIFTFKANIKIDDSLIMTDDNIKTNSPNFMYKLNDLSINDDSNSDGDISNLNTNIACPIDIFNLKLGIAVYYLKYAPTNKTGSVSIQLPTSYDSDGNSVYLVNNGIAQWSDSENDDYPDFENNAEDEDPIPYVMTNLYINSSDLINLYTNMSYIVRSTTDISDNGKYILFRDVPLIQYSKVIDSDISNRVTNIITDTKSYLDEINMRLDNSFSIDYKFFRTYGPCQYFKLENTNSTEQIVLNNLDISLTFNARIKSGVTSTDSNIISQLKEYTKLYIEKLNDEDDDYTIYMSNITTELERNFSDILKSIDLVDLNGYGDKYRVIFYDKPELDTYNAQMNGKQLIKNYVPEYINLPLENITINIIR